MDPWRFSWIFLLFLCSVHGQLDWRNRLVSLETHFAQQRGQDQINTTPRFTVLAPDVLRADNDENLVLQADGVSAPVQVSIQIWDFSKKSVLTESSATLDSTNGYHKLHSIRLPIGDLKPEEKQEKFVYLKVTFEGFPAEDRLMLVSFHSGYIFIQTDKPIYNPGDTVLFRAFVSSPGFKAVEGAITVNIKNPDGIPVWQTPSTMRAINGVYNGKYDLSELVKEGLWTVTARFDHWEQNTFNSTFEVKKYVLPAFNVTLTPQKPFFSIDDTELVITITARYLYGQPVEGKAYVMFGIKHEREKIRLPVMKQINLSEGKVSLLQSDLTAVYPNIRMIAGKSIYVKASVLTQSGGDLVEVEKGGIRVVISPYVLSFRDPPQFFKPGLPLDLTLDVRYHDGSPVHDVEVKLTFRDSPLRINHGSSPVTINMPRDKRTQPITAETVQPGLRPEQQARTVLTLGPYQTPGQPLNLLHISWENSRVAVGKSLFLTLKAIVEKPEHKEHIKHITYMVLNKGSIVKAERVDVTSQAVTGVTLSVTPDMMPSFRVVAFYSLPWAREEEVVADSIYVDVEDSCPGKVSVGPDQPRYSDPRPGTSLRLKLQGEPGATVSVVAVDNAVFLLRKERLTQSKIWGVVEQSDLGCSHGGGRNARGVFSSAGLSFHSSTGFKTPFRQTLQCPRGIRWRRSAAQLQRKAELERQYKDELLRRCCVDGLRQIPMAYSCTRRSLYITEGVECIRAFRHCCGTYRGEPIDDRMPTAMPSFITTTTPTTTSAPLHRLMEIMPYSGRIELTRDMFNWGNSRGRSFSGVSAYGSRNVQPGMETARLLVPPQPEIVNVVSVREEDGEPYEEPFQDLEDFEVDLRNKFQQSWLFDDFRLPSSVDASTGLSSETVVQPLHDSITEWGILAVSSSTKTGFCVAEPYNVRAWKAFFVDLKLPYTVARNEQIQIKAVVYNHSPTDRQAIVTLMQTQKMCSVAFRDKHKQEISVPAGGSAVVPYTVVPQDVGDLPIEVMVVTKDENMMSDRIRKNLKVVREGVQKTKVWSVVLDPSGKGGNQTVRMGKIELGPIVPNSVPETKINIRGNLLADSVENALQPDSLASLIRMPGGCVEQNLASMSLPTIAFLYLERTNDWGKVGVYRKDEALGYIRKGYSNQLAYRREDGSYPPYRKQGASTWITAFVVKVFSMAHSIIGVEEQQVCEPLLFLLKNRHKPDQGVFKEENPVYSTTMTGGLRGDDPEVTLTAFVLISLAEAKQAGMQCNSDGVNTEDVIRNTANYLKRALFLPRRPYTVAIASYALALFKEQVDFNPTQALLRASTDGKQWVDSENPLFSLEATGYALLALVKMDAMTEAEPAFKWLNSQRRIGGGYGSTQPTVVVLQALSEFLVRQPPPKNLGLNVKVEMGARTIGYHFNLDTSYIARTARLPDNADLVVQAEGTGQGILEVVTYYNQLHEEEEKTPCKDFDLQVTIEESTEKPPPDVVNVYLMTIKVRALGPKDVRMVVLDVSLPTGFTPENSDLEALSNSVDKYLANFKVVDNLSDRGSLILHLFKVSHKEQEILIFKLQQNFKVGHIQPSSVTAYEYYNPDHRCSRSFTPRERTEQLTQICRDHVCRCTQGDCCEPKKDTDNFFSRDRETFACETLHHVYKVTVQSVSPSYYDRYELQIREVIKLGAESSVVQGQTRTFLSHGACREGLNLVPNQDYLIMGPASDLWNIDSATNRFMYLLGKDTWVERWPSAEECSTTYGPKCESLVNMTSELSINACRL